MSLHVQGNNALQPELYEVFRRYKDDISTLVGYTYPGLSKEEISMALDYSIQKRFKNSPCVLDNNYKQIQVDSTLLDMIEFIMSNDDCIVTPFGVLFSKKTQNPLNKMIQKFLTLRKQYKKEMFKHPKDDDLSSVYQKFNLLQLLSKIDKLMSSILVMI